MRLQPVVILGLGFICSCECAFTNWFRQPLHVQITGEEFHWQFRYPGEDNVLGNDDDTYHKGDLHLPIGVEVRLLLQSLDYIYTFAVPKFGAREIAVPELQFYLDFMTEHPDTVKFVGDVLCGFTHESLSGKVVIVSQTDFSVFLATGQHLP